MTCGRSCSSALSVISSVSPVDRPGPRSADELLEEGRLRQLPRRHVDHDGQPHPRRTGPRDPEHAAPDRHDETRLLGERQPLAGHPRAPAVLPPRQRLDADHAHRARLDHRLVVHRQLVVDERDVQLAAQRLLGLHACPQGVVEHHDAGPRALALEHRGVGLAQQLVGRRARLRAPHRDPGGQQGRRPVRLLGGQPVPDPAVREVPQRGVGLAASRRRPRTRRPRSARRPRRRRRTRWRWRAVRRSRWSPHACPCISFSTLKPSMSQYRTASRVPWLGRARDRLRAGAARARAGSAAR